MIWVQQQIYNKMSEEEKNQGVQTSAWLKCCGETFRELCINKFLQTSRNWSNVVKKSGPKFFHNNMKD